MIWPKPHTVLIGRIFQRPDSFFHPTVYIKEKILKVRGAAYIQAFISAKDDGHAKEVALFIIFIIHKEKNLGNAIQMMKIIII